MSQMKAAPPEETPGESGPNAKVGTVAEAQLGYGFIRVDGDPGKVRVTGRMFDLMVYNLNGALGRFGAAWQTANPVRHAVQVQRFIAQEPVLVGPADSADVSQCSAA
jgi:hypothetical protein